MHVICFSWTLPPASPLQMQAAFGPVSGLPGVPSALGRFRPGLSADHFGFGDRKATNSRLGPAKVPQPGVDDTVDLIDMAAPA